jgi:hypothetical protein
MLDRFFRSSRASASTGTEARVLRERQQAHLRALDRETGRRKPFTTARLLVQVYDGGSMGDAADLIYFTHPVLATGAETEGGAAVLTADTATTIPVVVLGHAPAVGDYLTAYAVGGRWVSERGSAGGLTFCGCVVPTTGVLTSTLFGEFAMTYHAVGSPFGVPEFTGTRTYTYPGNVNCSAATISLTAIILCYEGSWSLVYGVLAPEIDGPCTEACPGTSGVAATTGGVLATSVVCAPLNVVWHMSGYAQICDDGGALNLLGNLLAGSSDTATFTA